MQIRYFHVITDKKPTCQIAHIHIHTKCITAKQQTLFMLHLRNKTNWTNYN